MDHLNSTTNSIERKPGEHFKESDRGIIQAMRKQHMSYQKIADELHCSKSAVWYEVNRNTPKRRSDHGRHPVYQARRAQKMADNRRQHSRRTYICDQCPDFLDWMTVQVKGNNMSVDVCVGKARNSNMFPNEPIPCTKTLYNAIWDGRIDDVTVMDLPEAISRRKRHNNNGKTKTRDHKKTLGESIDNRPEIVSKREEFGHWEGDSVMGKKKAGEANAITLLEKKTGNYITLKADDHTSTAAVKAVKKLLSEYSEHVHEVFKSITWDNGSEFTEMNSLDVKSYFAHPSAPWERGQNERHNRMLRQYLPKGESMNSYTEDEIRSMGEMISDIPRRNLDYHSASELFEAELDKIYHND